MNRQFDVFVSPPAMRSFYPYFTILQHDSVSSTADIVVAPLVHPSSTRPARINPLLEVCGRSLVLQTANLVAISRSRLRDPVENLAESRSPIIAAIDLWFAGS